MDVMPLVLGHGRAVAGARFRRHLRAVTARHLGCRFTDLRLGRPGDAGTGLGTQVGAIEAAASRRGERDVLAGFAVVDLVVRHCRTGECESDCEN